jgi:YgiT-type zinc finger domain-containing protein
MKCFECGEEMISDSIEHVFTISGVKVRGNMPAMRCPACGESSVDGDALGQHAVRTPEVFRFMRKAIGMRAVDLAELLDADPATISRWERGKLDVDKHAFALLAELVEDRVNGKTSTEERLKLLAHPPKAFPRELELAQPAA